jgi:hypothetical protein
MANDWADKITRPATSHALDGLDMEQSQYSRQQPPPQQQRHDFPDHAFAPGASVMHACMNATCVCVYPMLVKRVPGVRLAHGCSSLRRRRGSVVHLQDW